MIPSRSATGRGPCPNASPRPSWMSREERNCAAPRAASSLLEGDPASSWRTSRRSWQDLFPRGPSGTRPGASSSRSEAEEIARRRPPLGRGWRSGLSEHRQPRAPFPRPRAAGRRTARRRPILVPSRPSRASFRRRVVDEGRICARLGGSGSRAVIFGSHRPGGKCPSGARRLAPPSSAGERRRVRFPKFFTTFGTPVMTTRGRP